MGEKLLDLILMTMEENEVNGLFYRMMHSEACDLGAMEYLVEYRDDISEENKKLLNRIKNGTVTLPVKRVAKGVRKS